MPAANMARIASPYSTNTMLTTFWVTRKRRMASSADSTISPMISPPCHWIDHPLTAGNAYPRKATIDVPVATITSTPGHQAQKPAKNPQNGPNALFVHRKMDPAPGNIAPAWPGATGDGIRNTTNPMIHHPNADGPADWITAAFVMNRTIATKIATMSNVVSTLGRMPPATRSEISEPESVSVVIAALP